MSIQGLNIGLNTQFGDLWTLAIHNVAGEKRRSPSVQIVTSAIFHASNRTDVVLGSLIALVMWDKCGLFLLARSAKINPVFKSDIDQRSADGLFGLRLKSLT